MREILFRGKRIDNGEWVECYYVKAVHHWHKHGIHEDWIITGASANGGWFAIHNRYAVDPETVGQYTGLTANGKKIFEGDILEFGDKIGYVNYGTGCFSVKIVHPIHLNHNNPAIDIVLNECPNGIEVIGNIHDNPELLEGGADDR